SVPFRDLHHTSVYPELWLVLPARPYAPVMFPILLPENVATVEPPVPEPAPAQSTSTLTQTPSADMGHTIDIVDNSHYLSILRPLFAGSLSWVPILTRAATQIHTLTHMRIIRERSGFAKPFPHVRIKKRVYTPSMQRRC